MASIVIIDDDDVLREILAKSLTYAGHQIRQANNGKKGVALVRTEPPDIVVTDLVMPEQEGIETIRMLRREFPQLGIIAMSGGVDGSPLYLDLTKRLGASATLTKPFTPKELTEAIEQILSRKPHVAT